MELISWTEGLENVFSPESMNLFREGPEKQARKEAAKPGKVRPPSLLLLVGVDYNISERVLPVYD